MKAQEYTYQFDELDISIDIIEKFMGYEPGHAPEPIPQLIEEVLGVAHDYCDIKGGYVINDQVEINRVERIISINGVQFDVKRIITNQLRKMDDVALFACTAGPGIGDYSKELMHEGDFVKGYIGPFRVRQSVVSLKNIVGSQVHICSDTGPIGLCDTRSL